MKRLLKIISFVMAIVLVFGAIVSAVVLRSSSEVLANETFDGIDNIIEGSASEPFKIYELVPDSSMGELGYLIPGQEPVNWLEELTKYSSSTDRTNRFNALKSALNNISATDKSKPLTYVNYQEAYALPQGAALGTGLSDWKKLELANPDIIPAGNTMYHMDLIDNTDVDDDAILIGDYDLYNHYTKVEGNAPTGHYNENVAFYQYSENGGYYDVTFKKADLPVDETTGERVRYDEDGNEIRIYKKSDNAILILSGDKFAEVKEKYPNATIYRVSTSNINGALEYVGKINSVDITAEEIENSEDYLYYVPAFSYVTTEITLSDSEVYYVVDTSTFCPNEDGEYVGIRDSVNEYVEAEQGWFEKDTEEFFHYVGEGYGHYKLRVENDSTTPLTKELHFSTVYYKGGFENNNWFAEGVFKQGDQDVSNMIFDVKRIIPTEFASMSNPDLLYISGKAFASGKSNPASFSKNNDITWDNVRSIVMQVQSESEKLPVIVDFGILSGTSNWSNNLTSSTGSRYNNYSYTNLSNIQLLVALLSTTYEYSMTSTTEKSAINWDSVRTGITDTDRHFVNGSVYVIPGNTSVSSTPYLFQSFTTSLLSKGYETVTNNANFFENNTTFESDYSAIGFGEIAEVINTSNLARRTENEAKGEEAFGYFDRKISKAISIEYIISLKNDEEDDVSNVVKILDIEPAAVNVDDNQGENYEQYEKSNKDTISKRVFRDWYGSNAPTVEIVHMTTSEFIGNITDLSEYDMIYIGMNTISLNTTSGVTQYNDSAMNGLIYTNVGDVAVITTNHAGLLDSDYTTNGNIVALNDNNKNPANANATINDSYRNAYNTYRYSGNDITVEKIRKLENYLLSGRPVVVANKFYKESNGNTYANMNAVDDYYVDNCSHMYDFINGWTDNDGTVHKPLKDYSCAFSVAKLKANRSYFKSILNLGKPYIKMVNIDKTNGSYYKAINTNIFNLEFKISNRGAADKNAEFDVTLYLDKNADGKFSNDEAVPSTSVIISSNNSGSAINAGNSTYNLKYVLPEDYVGMIPWRLKVSQKENAYRYDLEDGYIKVANDVKKTIKVLQIGQNSDRKTGNSAERFDMTSNTTFANKMRQAEALTGISLKITYQTSDSFINNWYNKDISALEYNDATGTGYHMIIVGFADMFHFSNGNDAQTESATNLLKQYIERKNPVLFTHDTTSFANNKYTKNGNSSLLWGYDFNTQIRDVVGMDRYGILKSTALKKGNKLTSGSADYAKAVKYAQDNNTDIAYQPKSNKSVIVRQNQGLAYGDMVRYATRTTYNSGWNSTRGYNKYYYLKGIEDGDNKPGDPDTTTTIQKVNAGQITYYPFYIEDTIDNIATTHAQYYQLDMNEDEDGDGESDIVVWYTLDSKSYAKSPKDVRNNYYIYTKGNVTYSGVGHSSISNAAEMELYINTMYAAYSVAVSAPSIELMDSDKENADSLTTIFDSFEYEKDSNDSLVMDSESVEEEVDASSKSDYKSIYFKVEDENLIRSGEVLGVRVRFFTSSDSAKDLVESKGETNPNTISVDGVNVYRLKDSLNDSNATGNDIIKIYRDNAINEAMYQNSVIYRVDIPTSVLKNYKDFYVVADTAVEYSYGLKYSSYVYKQFSFQKVGLFELE